MCSQSQIFHVVAFSGIVDKAEDVKRRDWWMGTLLWGGNRDIGDAPWEFTTVPSALGGINGNLGNLMICSEGRVRMRVYAYAMEGWRGRVGIALKSVLEM